MQDNQLYEWSLKKIGLALGVGTAALVGKGLKMAYNSAVVKKAKSKLDEKLEEFKSKIDNIIKSKVSEFKKYSEGQQVSDKVKKDFEKKLSSYINKELSVLSKNISAIIDKKKIPDSKKNSLKIYWESITTSLELEIFERFFKLNLISDEEKEKRTKESATELEKLVKAFMETFDPDREAKEKDKIQKIEEEFDKIKATWKDKNNSLADPESQKKYKSKIDNFQALIGALYEKISLEHQKKLDGIKGGLESIESALDEYMKSHAEDVKINKYVQDLFHRISVFRNSKKRIIMKAIDSEFYNYIESDNKLKEFIRYTIGKILEDPTYYESELKVLKGASMTDKSTLAFLRKFWIKANQEDDDIDVTESFVSLNDYLKDRL